MSDKYNAVVVERLPITPDLFIIKVKTDAPLAAFISGQYVLLGLSSNMARREGSPPEFKEAKADRMVLRAYSIASSGHEPEILEFYISVVANGSLTPRLVQLQVGDRLMVGDKIRGFFTLDTVTPGTKNIILAATGTGLAPFVSMMRHHAVHPYHYRFLILHGAPKSWELGYIDELTKQSQILPRITYIPSITRLKEDPIWKGENGRITQYFKDSLLAERFEIELNPAETSVFLCGNPAMIEEVTHLLGPKGYMLYSTTNPGSLHTEEYW